MPVPAFESVDSYIRRERVFSLSKVVVIMSSPFFPEIESLN